MTTFGITGAGLAGTLRLTWVRDDLEHVLSHAEDDETSGTWTGLACPDHGLPLGRYVAPATLRQLASNAELADMIWESPDDLAAEHNRVFDAAMRAYHAGNTQAVEQRWRDVRETWSHAWTANRASLEFMQSAGLTRFAPVKPQRWVIASFEHHCGPHGVQHPHVHNIVIPRLTRGI